MSESTELDPRVVARRRTHRIQPRGVQRPDGLSKQRIIDTAIDILDSDGEGALTFRALTTRLSTGAGAIYYYVADKNELLAASTNAVIARAMSDLHADPDPRREMRATAVAVFDALDAHPWLGAQLSREPWQYPFLHLLETFGGQVDALGVPGPSRFDCASVLVSFVLGFAGQYSAVGRLAVQEAGPPSFLSAIESRSSRLDPTHYPFVSGLSEQRLDHDDRERFLASVDVIIAGISATRA